jgi:hypothetical protein
MYPPYNRQQELDEFGGIDWSGLPSDQQNIPSFPQFPEPYPEPTTDMDIDWSGLPSEQIQITPQQAQPGPPPQEEFFPTRFNSEPTVTDTAPNWLQKFRTPLTDIGRRVASRVEAAPNPHAEYQDEEGRAMAEMGKGAIGLLGHGFDEATAAINILPMALFGAANALKSPVLNLLGRAASIPTAVSGIEHIASGKNWLDKVMGVAETVGGALGAKTKLNLTPKPNVAQQAEEIIASAPRIPETNLPQSQKEAIAEALFMSDEEYDQMYNKLTEYQNRMRAGTLSASEIEEAKRINKIVRAHPNFGRPIPTPELPDIPIPASEIPPEGVPTASGLPLMPEEPLAQSISIPHPNRPNFPDYSPKTEMMARQFLNAVGVKLKGNPSNKQIIDAARYAAEQKYPSTKKAVEMGTGGYIPGSKTPEQVPFGRQQQPVSEGFTAQQQDMFARQPTGEIPPSGPLTPRGTGPDDLTIPPGMNRAQPSPVAQAVDAHYGELFGDIERKLDANGKPIERPKMMEVGKGEFVNSDYPDFILDSDGNVLRTVSGLPINTPEVVKRSLWKTAANTPRAIQASMDLSFPLRQGIGLIHKPAWWKAWGGMVKSFGSDKAFKGVMDSIMDRANYKPNIRYQKFNPTSKKMEPTSFAEWSGLAITDMTNAAEMEHMRSLAESWPGVKHSNRAYTAFANKLRADVFDDLVNQFTKAGMDPRNNRELAKELAEFVNTASGRGSIEKLEKHMDALSTGFFSPRLQIARAKMGLRGASGIAHGAMDLGRIAKNDGFSALADPKTYAMMKPDVRREYMKSMLALAGAWGSMTTFASMLPGVSTSLDTTNPDFGKIKIGDTRIDLGGGFQQFLVFAMKSLRQRATRTSEPDNPRYFDDASSAYDPTWGKEIGNFAYSKASPLGRLAVDLAMRTQGRPFDTADELARLGTPIIAQDLFEVLMNEGIDPEMLGAIPEFIGAGVQTYGGKKQLFDEGSQYDRRMLGPNLGQNLAWPRKRGMFEGGTFSSGPFGR